MDSSTPFATILAGQPTLRHSIKLGVLAALDQRITVRYQMKGMTPDETTGYIRHHLEAAGRTADLFTDDAVTQIHQAARGKSRTVNNICLAALIATAGVGKNLVETKPPEPPSPRSPRQTEHPRDTLNTQPRPAPRGGALHCEHILSPDDAATLTLNDAQQTKRSLVGLAGYTTGRSWMTYKADMLKVQAGQWRAVNHVRSPDATICTRRGGCACGPAVTVAIMAQQNVRVRLGRDIG